jgi:hypothetical protein
VTFSVFIDFVLIAGACGILTGSICLLALRRHRIAIDRSHAELRSMLREQEVEWSARIEQLNRGMAILELRAQNYDEVAKGGGLTHSVRLRAMQLLRSGMSPESAASTLGIGRREMRLIAGVSRTLSLH